MYPAVLAKFMRSVDLLCFEERPDYASMRNLLMEEVRAEADSQDEDGEDEVFVNLEIRLEIKRSRLRSFGNFFSFLTFVQYLRLVVLVYRQVANSICFRFCLPISGRCFNPIPGPQAAAAPTTRRTATPR